MMPHCGVTATIVLTLTHLTTASITTGSITSGSVVSNNVDSSSVSLSLVLYDSVADDKLVCNDGTPGGYYIREVDTSDQWIFYLEGGGWCWNNTSCQHRISSNGQYRDIIVSREIS